MPTQKAGTERSDLVTILESVRRPLSPDQLMDAAGFSNEAIGEFYDALRSAVNSGRIKEFRPSERTVLLEIVGR